MLFNPSTFTRDTLDYGIDAMQRAVLYADIMRARGNQYRAHMQETAPNVLNFAAELVMRGDTLPQSLLGQSFLGQLGEVSIRNDRMLLR